MLERIEIAIVSILPVHFFIGITSIERERPKRIVQIKKKIFLYFLDEKSSMSYDLEESS